MVSITPLGHNSIVGMHPYILYRYRVCLANVHRPSYGVPIRVLTHHVTHTARDKLLRTERTFAKIIGLRAICLTTLCISIAIDKYWITHSLRNFFAIKRPPLLTFVEIWSARR